MSSSCYTFIAEVFLPRLRGTVDLQSTRRRGAALLFAISILGLFSALGMFYVRYMNLELADASFELRKKRVRHVANAGVQSAAAVLQQSLSSGGTRPLTFGEAYTVELPTYDGLSQDESGVVVDEMPIPRLAEARITIFDESGKLNINHTPASALQRVLGVSGEDARKIAASVPAEGAKEGAQWYVGLNELIARGLMTEEAFASAQVSQSLTPYTVIDHTKPSHSLNINVASPEVLSAVLDLTPEQATQVKARGPYASAESLTNVIAEIQSIPVVNVRLDESIGFDSRCFRIVCEGRYGTIFVDREAYDMASSDEKRGLLMNVAVSRVEAVLLFAPDFSYEVIHWDVDVNIDDSA